MNPRQTLVERVLELALNYVDVTHRFLELQAENRALRAAVEGRPVQHKPLTPEEDLFADQVPTGSVVRDVTHVAARNDNLVEALEELNRKYRVPHRDTEVES